LFSFPTNTKANKSKKKLLCCVVCLAAEQGSKGLGPWGKGGTKQIAV